MRYLCSLAVCFTVLLACGAPGFAAGSMPPSTEGWFLTPVVDGSNVNLFIGIDNMDELLNWQGLVTRTWGDPSRTDPAQYISLGNGAILESMTVKVDADPQVSLEFAVVAGSNATTFTITSGAVSFAPIYCHGLATAAVTVTDRNGNGATATGGYTDGTFYKAMYNGGSQTFGHLIKGSISASPNASRTGTANIPPWVGIGGQVSDIQAEFKFGLSANDSASGTSNFVVMPVPEPGALANFLIGAATVSGFALRRRRRA